jgi:hypothetical protein
MDLTVVETDMAVGLSPFSYRYRFILAKSVRGPRPLHPFGVPR